MATVPNGFFETRPAPPRSRVLSAVAISVFAHLLFVMGVFKFVEPLVKPPHLSVVELLDVSELTSAQIAAKLAPAKAAAGEIKRKSKTESTKSPATSTVLPAPGANLSPSFRPNFLVAREAGSVTKESETAAGLGSSGTTATSFGDDPNAEWGSGSREFTRVVDIGRYTKLYDLIDSHVFYPNVFTKNGIEGVVNARLVLTSEGRCDWRKTRIRSKQGHLQVLVLSILHETCAANLKSFAKAEGSTNLDLSFGFTITEHDDKGLKDSEKKVVGNVFLFYRNNQQSAIEWQLGPFRGLFPVPFVALDFAWFEENYDRVINSRDPLREFSEHLKIQDETAHEG